MNKNEDHWDHLKLKYVKVFSAMPRLNLAPQNWILGKTRQERVQILKRHEETLQVVLL